MRITGIDTITIAEAPSLLILRLRTDEGLVGHADTWYAADALRAYIHDWVGPAAAGPGSAAHRADLVRPVRP